MRPEVKIQGGARHFPSGEWRAVACLSCKGHDDQDFVGEAWNEEGLARHDWIYRMQPIVRRVAKEWQEELDDEST